MKLVKISSEKIQIKSNDAEFQGVKINDLLKVSDDKVELVTMVTSLTDTDANYSLGEEDFIGQETSLKVIDCNIIGSLKDGLFVKSIDQYPTTNVVTEFIDNNKFRQMLSKYEVSGFDIGNYCAYDSKCFVNGNKLFQRHAAILGNTGSGKSETVAKILEEASRLQGTNIIVFDIHGEYSKLSYARNIKIGEDAPFPIWLFGLSDIATNILKIKEETATTLMTALRMCYHQICRGSENKPIYFDFNELVCNLESLDNQYVSTGEVYATGDKKGMAKTVKGDYNGKLSGLVNLLKEKRSDRRNNFLFEEVGQEYIFDLMSKILDNDKPIKNIDLSGIPHDTAISIIGCLTKLIYNIKLMQEDITPITILCDEAHVYIPNNFQLAPSERRMVEVFENIAKEGRKFGITLLPATQRPSELNKTILAQCGNFIVMKLNNENDKSIIKSMLPDGSESIVDSTTMFSAGECIVVGDATPMPLKIKVDLATERPNSRTVEFWDIWKDGSKMDSKNLIKAFLEE